MVPPKFVAEEPLHPLACLSYSLVYFVLGHFLGHLVARVPRLASPSRARVLAVASVLIPFSLRALVAEPSVATVAVAASAVAGSCAAWRWALPVFAPIAAVETFAFVACALTLKRVTDGWLELPFATACFVCILVLGALARRLPLQVRSARALVVANLIVIAAAFALNSVPGPSRPDFPAPSPRSGRPDVILVVLDTVRFDRLMPPNQASPSEAMSIADRLPTLAKLADDSVVFDRAYSTSNFTLASHASLFTGLYPSEHGAHYTREKRFGAPLSDQHQTLAELLAESGYWTIGVGANFGYLNPKLGLAQGFEAYYAERRLAILSPAPKVFLRRTFDDLLTRWLPRWFSESHRMSADEVMSVAVPWVEDAVGADAPFFLFLNFMEAHWPYLVPSDLQPEGGDLSTPEYDALRKRVMSRSQAPGREEEQRLSDMYDAAIRSLDRDLTVLFDLLRRLERYRDAIVIVTSDHGEAFGAKGYVGHASSVYEDQIHVPLLIKFPRSERVGRDSGVVSGVDVFPTILEAAGLSVPPGRLGRSLRGDRVRRPVFAEGRVFQMIADWHPRYRVDRHATVDGPHKLIQAGSFVELYDVERDPREELDLAPTSTTVVARLNTGLAVVTATVGSGGRSELDPELRAKLRALGYVAE